MDENNKFDVVGTNIAEKATMIWNVADMLRGPFKPHEYGLVILPMTVVKRFHDCLLPTHKAVLEQYEKVKNFAVIDGFLTKASGYQFYNISKYTFESLLADPENIEANFRDYLNGFSANVQDVLAKFDFDNIIRRMVESNTLYLVIKEFNSQKGYLGPDKISAVDCGYIFEDLVKRFSESFGEEAGAHFTSRDIIYLMTDLLLSDADLSKGGNVTVYDMAMGTSQMLSCMEERIQELNTEIGVTCFGQEFNPSTFAIAKADMMIRGGDPNNMRFGDTLSEDQFSGYQFQYIISNPPFGIDWKREKAAVEAEAKKGELGRFAPGLPKISDGQQLFVLNGLSKLAPNGKMAIIQNGSPLFSGDAGSGPSEIRRYILENDWLDAIVQLGTDMFMNTGISTYIWICSKDKPIHRAGKVQLIDASHCFEARRKSIGTKRNDITDKCRDLIVKAYGAFENGTIYGEKDGIYCQSKIFDTEEFGYQKIVVEQPQKDENGVARLNGMFLLIFASLSVVCILCGCVMMGNIRAIFGSGLTDSEYATAKVLMALLVVNLALTFPNSVFTCAITAHERFLFQKFLILLQNICNPLLALPLLIMGYGSIGMVSVTTFLTLFVLVMNIYYSFHNLHIRFCFREFQVS